MALSASDARLALVAVTTTGVTEAQSLLTQFEGTPDQIRAAVFESMPAVIGHYSLGSSAIAADWYDDLREAAGAPGNFTSEPVIPDRADKVRNMLGWATEPLYAAVPDISEVALRLLPNVQAEIASPNRATLTTNVRRDPAANGWRRVAAGGCKFCRFLAGRGEVYRKEMSARFASHLNCNCTAQPVFQGQPGEEVGVLQYVASKRRENRTPKQRQAINDALREMDAKPMSLTGKATDAAKAKPTSAFDAMTRDAVQKQLDITRGLKDSEWRTSQLARLEARIAELG